MPSLLPYLILISIICSCHLPNRIKSSIDTDCDSRHAFLYPRTEKFYTSINIFTKHYTGIVIVKQFSLDSAYITFVNELGFKFFEYLIVNNQFQKLYCFDKLNKPKAESMITDNLRLILEITKLKPRIFHNPSLQKSANLMYRKTSMDSTYKILKLSTNSCLYSNKIWLVKNSTIHWMGEFQYKNNLIITKHQLLPINFKFQLIE